MEYTAHTGRIHADGRPVPVVGVNYHPSRAGCRIWRDWDADAIRDDFAAVAGAGLTTVRLFLFWRDFEPEEGRPEPKAFARLAEAVATAAEHGLNCVLSVFTIFMNGQLLDPAWRDGRSLWRDPVLREREEAFARRVARTVRPYGNVLAFDLGDEISAVAPAEADGLSRAEVASWYERLADALRQEAPGTLVLQANNALSVFGPSPFSADNAGPLDLVGVHGFPAWAAGSIESTLSYKATSLNAFLARYAAAYGVPLVDELGSYAVDEETAAGYLAASAASALANGASGVLAWCWQDIASEEEPYRDRPAERFAGLRRLDGSAKPAFDRLVRLAGSAAELTPGPRPPRIAVHLPERVRARPQSYLDHGVGTVAAFYAHLLLKRGHLDYRFAVGPLDGHDLVICPSADRLTLTDVRRLRAAAEGGATVYISLGDRHHGFPGEELTGAEIADFALGDPGKASFGWLGTDWPVDWETGGNTPVTLRATTGRTVAAFADGTPAIVVNPVGAGRTVFCAVPLERILDVPGRLESAPWHRLYQGIAELAGIRPRLDSADPELEIVAGTGSAVLINHGTTAHRALGVTVAAKDWAVVALPDEGAES
ncbi:hypothetical protein ABZ714_21815 [Streptomyces sp. NPDC006798]|uniref:hypothetical protein n=1 Tax=Streptomyces sp. NPDC006798 TaxID=3155462 RepID=UPI0034062E65